MIGYKITLLSLLRFLCATKSAPGHHPAQSEPEINGLEVAEAGRANFTQRETQLNQRPKAPRKGFEGCESDVGANAELCGLLAPRVKSSVLSFFRRNPLRLNRRGPLNRRNDHTTKHAILLKLGGIIRKA